MTMRKYTLKLSSHPKIDKPEWFFDPPTNKQIKVLKFFGVDFTDELNKGRASGKVGEVFRDEGNRDLWERYIFHTGDDSQASAELAPYDLEELRSIVIPEDWKPGDDKRKLIKDIIKQGSPFDDPVPKVCFEESGFVFTGKFTSGTRSECKQAVIELGGKAQSKVGTATDYLVIGNEGSDRYKNKGYGNKIEDAMILRMDIGKPVILSEGDWLAAVQQKVL